MFKKEAVCGRIQTVYDDTSRMRDDGATLMRKEINSYTTNIYNLPSLLYNNGISYLLQYLNGT